MANTIWMESGTDATAGLEFWTSSSGASSSTAASRTGPRSVALTNVGTIMKAGVLADAGRRITFGFRCDSLPAATAALVNLVNGAAGNMIRLRLQADGKLQICNAANSVTVVGTTAINTGSFNRIAISFVVTSGTNWTCKVYLNGAAGPEITATNSNFSITPGLVDLRFDAPDVACYLDDIYVDNGTDNLDPGNISVTAKLPANDNAHTWSTIIGSDPGAGSRYTLVDDRPVDDTKGVQETGTSQVTESFTLQTASAGDVDLTGVTILSRIGWVRMQRGLGVGEVVAQVTPQEVTPPSAATSRTFTPGVAIPAGCTVVLAIGTDDNLSITSVTDNTAGGLNSYSSSTAATAGAGTSPRLQYYYCTLTTAWTASTTVTLNHASSGVKGAVGVLAFAGIGSPTTIDQTKNNTGSGTSQTTNASSTLSQANEVCIGALIQNTGTAYGAAISGFTDVGSGRGGSSGGSAATNIQMNFGYKKVAATTAQTAAATGANVAWAASLITFRVSADPTADQVGTPGIVLDGSTTAITLSTTTALYTVISDSASYPGNAAGIGARSSGANADSYLYECGVLIAYRVIQDTPELYGRPFGLRGQSQMTQLLSQ